MGSSRKGRNNPRVMVREAKWWQDFNMREVFQEVKHAKKKRWRC